MALYPRTFNPTGSWIRTEHQPRFQRNLSCVNTVEENRNTAPLWIPPSKQQYQYMRSTRFSASKYWRESGDRCAVVQEEHHGMVKLPISTPQHLTFVANVNHPQPISVKSNQVAPPRPVAVAPVRKEENLTFVGNFTHAPNITQDQLFALLNSQKAPVSGSAGIRGVASTQKTPVNLTWPCNRGSEIMKHAYPSTVVDQLTAQEQELLSVTAVHQPDTGGLTHEAGRLTFVGNFTASAAVLHGQQRMKPKEAQVPGRVAQEGFISLGVGPTWSTPVAPAGLPTGAGGEIPTYCKSRVQYNQVDYVKTMEYHRDMASYYRELKRMAEHVPVMEGSVCPHKLQTGSVRHRSLDEPLQKTWWEDASEGIVLPDDAVEKLDAIPGIWDLAIQMGFLTVC
ncbi:uncharacterized protein LOC121706315 isoform X2 [Alosa sapidissima]|uniref:uncharacterized protein LOC121706315 isoform X2 n=1 Tax=Alosa sapidissima TaxID=34773 RepID=UPI001C082E20|nr:uncharacterized protein LOC121706315 isoform X2 [Alosa sapidissima]